MDNPHKKRIQNNLLRLRTNPLNRLQNKQKKTNTIQSKKNHKEEKKMTFNKEEFKEIAQKLEKANTEQLWFIQKYIESLINDKINQAAVESGLIKVEEIKE
jgi:hypothetical protein